QTLVALSCVCRSFTDVALDVLWAELEDLEPLFTCLPRDLWTMTSDRKLLIRRPVTTTDWSVFKRYASRVRVLGRTHLNPFGGVDAEFIYAVTSFSSQSLLVPNLRILDCRICPRDLHPCMRYLLSPTEPQPPQLQVIGLHVTSPQVMELALCGLPHLREVSLTTTMLSSETLSHLSRLTGLQKLDICVTGRSRGVQSQFCTSSLDILAINSSTLTFSGHMVKGWVVPCRDLTLEFSIAETALAVERALHTLHNRLFCDTLERILVYGHTDNHVNDVDYAFNLRTFTPLMHFSCLKTVDLPSFCMSLLDDDALSSIVKSWPHLEYLDLGTTYVSQIPPKITFQGIVTVVSSCPHLRNLALVFDATKVDPPTAENPGGGVCNTYITTFDAGWSPIEQPLQVAVALSAILPCLRNIDVELDFNDELSSEDGSDGELEEGVSDRKARKTKWKEVSGYIGVLTLVRQQGGSHV
ncbi:uncharacterized protein EDB91DRAFT_1055617, partial [Suillus paluster]|uniref:uncharacterized protein n=1 Tax=Suillus paluster TaxID=48578 RepID=UPI001B8821E7